MTSNKRKDFSTVAYLRVRERLDRDWAYFLSATEVRVLGWVISMTLGWRNTEGSFSLKQMLKGIPNRGAPNEYWVRGMGLSPYTLQRALKRLVEIGVLSVRWGNGKKTYAVNRNWEPTVRDGSRLTNRDPSETSDQAKNEQAPCSNLATQPSISSTRGANSEHPYETNNTRQIPQATQDGRSSPIGSGDSSSLSGLSARLDEYEQERRYGHLWTVPASELSEHQRERVLSQLSEEDGWTYQELVYVRKMPERQALLEMSHRIALRGEDAQFKEGKRVKAKRLYRLADVLRLAATAPND